MIDVLTDPQVWLYVLGLSVLGSLARLPNYYAGFRGKDAIESLSIPGSNQRHVSERLHGING